MPPTLEDLGIDRLSVDDRIAVAQAIWDSLTDEPLPSMLTELQRNELRQRLAEHARNPADVVAWEQVHAEARARWTK
jgi:putative addiction module component (TIGR02574 family)